MDKTEPGKKGHFPTKPAVTDIAPEQAIDFEQWKHRPPYQIQSPDEFGEAKWSGSCQCGQVTYKIRQEKPLIAKYCHCHGCQVMHGAPFQWSAVFCKPDICFVKGAEGLTFYSSSHRTKEYEAPTKVSCSFCKSPIMDEGRNMCLVFPELITIGDSDEEHSAWRRAFEPICHIYYCRRVMEVLDGKPKWAGMDDDSELMDDNGNILKSEDED
ncbi:hypothetical protein ASPWEDRAFT_174225 [Aspergillus wentii DTO 134E9]|uniref:CENP-V/GFA domain-containing protein n=1 Tax=Aspergillus wentii DTO 134E9 TaxID=1073089 RepID=A0A1L9RCZ5_ASPWE|nr:uncharacterized protein ASPWEDRAFT_174225 [Aspergillus wentii DTO 134E9]KAI9933059.1 hypothetical protein MW887_007530 [Aspergillus wentii]OJJ32781.1 hypothetical protein ASPWEDRAFT_174225 [Aspergillus wentii DTO 134E9]